MAIVQLTRREANEIRLPAVCMCCGAPATAERFKKFAWHPPWVWVTLLGGLLPAVIVAAVLTKRMAVFVPLCEDHKNHWSWRLWFTWLSFAGMAVLGIGAVAVLSSLRNSDVGGLVCIVLLVLALVWLIVIAIIQSHAIRPKEITDYDITLMNVSRGFGEAMSQRWAHDDRDLRPIRPRRRGPEDEHIQPADPF